jgi:glutamate racemase
MLTGLLSVVLGENVTLVSSAEETAKEVYRVLTDRAMLRPDGAPAPEHIFRATGPADLFNRLGQRFLGGFTAAATDSPLTVGGGDGHDTGRSGTGPWGNDGKGGS